MDETAQTKKSVEDFSSNGILTRFCEKVDFMLFNVKFVSYRPLINLKVE